MPENKTTTVLNDKSPQPKTIKEWFDFALENGHFTQNVYDAAIKNTSNRQIVKKYRSLSEALMSAFYWYIDEDSEDTKDAIEWVDIRNELIEKGL